MLNHVLMPDTQAILLLCASFGQSRQTEPQPLRLNEYNFLATWLRENQMRPADLLDLSGKERLQEMIDAKLNYQRLVALLERGAMLGLAVENWTNKGLWVLGRSDAHYPKCLKEKLKHSAPPILYGVGNIELLSGGGLAVVGSRDVDEAAISYAQRVAKTCAEQAIQLVSGSARGVDEAAMLSGSAAGGTALGVIADSLTRAAVSGKYRSAIREGRLTFVSPYDPDAGFHVGNAMGRNKHIYALSDYALVVSCSVDKGGTWSGAVEALQRENSVPVFVWMQGAVPEGNHQLLDKGAKAFPDEPWNGSLTALLNLVAQGDRVTNAALSVESTQNNVLQVQSQSNPAAVAVNEVLLSPVAVARSGVSKTYPKDIYEAVLPFILNNLEQPKNAKSLAECLDVRLGQMQDWLNRAVAEGKVKKTTKPVAYVVNSEASQLSLLD